MRLTYGGVAIGDMNACAIEPRNTLLRNERGIGHGIGVSYPFECSFAVAGQADCQLKMAAIEAALTTPGGDLLFLNDNGTPSQNSVLSANTLTGVRCVEWTWARDAGAQFMTWRKLRGTFEYEIRFANPAGFLLDFSETVRIRNPVGGNFVVNEFVNDMPPTIRDTVKFPKSTATQNGFAIGLSAYPDINYIAPPLWPAVLPGGARGPLKGFSPELTSPKRKGESGLEAFRVEWSYEFESPVPLIALPNVWI